MVRWVLDTSVVVKWFLPEEDTGKAELYLVASTVARWWHLPWRDDALNLPAAQPGHRTTAWTRKRRLVAPWQRFGTRAPRFVAWRQRLATRTPRLLAPRQRLGWGYNALSYGYNVLDGYTTPCPTAATSWTGIQRLVAGRSRLVASLQRLVAGRERLGMARPRLGMAMARPGWGATLRCSDTTLRVTGRRLVVSLKRLVVSRGRFVTALHRIVVCGERLGSPCNESLRRRDDSSSPCHGSSSRGNGPAYRQDASCSRRHELLPPYYNHGGDSTTRRPDIQGVAGLQQDVVPISKAFSRYHELSSADHEALPCRAKPSHRGEKAGRREHEAAAPGSRHCPVASTRGGLARKRARGIWRRKNGEASRLPGRTCRRSPIGSVTAIARVRDTDRSLAKIVGGVLAAAEAGSHVAQSDAAVRFSA